MMQSYHQSIQESSEDSPSSNPIQLLHHVLVLKITTDERVSFSKWYQYNGYYNTQDICEGLPFRLEDLLEYSDYIVNGQHCALNFSTLNTILLFIFWIENRTNGYKIPLSPQYFLSLTYQEFNKFRQENMSRMTKVPTTKPLLSHNTQSKLDSLPHLIDQYDESVCESAEENLLHHKELKYLHTFVPYSTNLFELPKATKTSTPNQPWEGFCLKLTRPTLKIPRKSKWLTLTHTQLFVTLIPNHPLFWIQLIPNPSQFTLQTFVIHLMTHLKIWKSHLSESTSTTTNLNETCFLETSCEDLLHLDSPSFSSELQDNSIFESNEPESCADFEDILQFDSTSVSSHDCRILKLTTLNSLL